jgi:hypothetical protein
MPTSPPDRRLNDDPKPFVWTKTEQILASLTSHLQTN